MDCYSATKITTFSTSSKCFKKNVTNSKDTPKKRDRFPTEMEVKSRGVKGRSVTNTKRVQRAD